MSAAELRERIIEVAFKNGGHLASSLGAVEIAMALREVFDPEIDRVLWDVGHQAYAWKLLTVRTEKFDTLRKFGGVAPFPLPSESRADAAVAGHAGSALSVALGLAAARDRRGSSEHVVAVVGDASLANGHSFEALNNCAAATKKLIVVLNDNEMSISRPVGALSGVLAKLLVSVRYNRLKSAAENAGHRLGLTFIREIYHKVESRIKGLFLGSRFFEQFGLRYIGPVDGHDLAALRAAFTVAKEDKRSVVVHVFTRKGKGYAPAEAEPTKYHGIAAGGPKNAEPDDWSAAVGRFLVETARSDGRVVALTAGMTEGTGLAAFAQEFPARFYDVGIAEGHLVAFAAGLAAGGMRPVVCIYATFLQRAIDQVIHDVAIANLPVVICVDRAGVVGADGATHQGLYDYALLKSIPNLTICQPCDGEELKNLLSAALQRQGPTVIRYPRGPLPRGLSPAISGACPQRNSAISGACPQRNSAISRGLSPTELSVQVANPGAATQIWTTGDYLGKAQLLAEKNGFGVVYARYLKPFDLARLMAQRAAGKRILSMENGCVKGGFGETIGADERVGWPDEFIPHGSVRDLEQKYLTRIRAD